MDLTGLERGPELGAFMAHLRTHVFTLMDLAVSPQEAIDAKIRCAFSMRTYTRPSPFRDTYAT